MCRKEERQQSSNTKDGTVGEHLCEIALAALGDHRCGTPRLTLGADLGEGGGDYKVCDEEDAPIPSGRYGNRAERDCADDAGGRESTRTAGGECDRRGENKPLEDSVIQSRRSERSPPRSDRSMRARNASVAGLVPRRERSARRNAR